MAGTSLNFIHLRVERFHFNREFDSSVSAQLSSTFSAFLFRPFMFFIIPGLVVLLLAMYSLGWATFHVGSALPDTGNFSDAVAVAYADRPHAFIVGGIGLIVAFQFLSLGFIAVQNKRYFEELFHLGTSVSRQSQAPLYSDELIPPLSPSGHVSSEGE